MLILIAVVFLARLSLRTLVTGYIESDFIPKTAKHYGIDHATVNILKLGLFEAAVGPVRLGDDDATFLDLLRMFFAEKGKGAFLNANKISVSSTQQISNSLIATGFPYDRWQNGDFYIAEYLAFMKKCQGMRRVGAASLDLCFVAAGRLDGFFERKLKPWDMAAGSVILSEAGGKITCFDGYKWNPFDETIVASNKIIHRQMVEILGRAHENE